MLKAEHPCHETFSTYRNPGKPPVTWIEAKKHLQDIRLRRQTQQASNIEECVKLRNLHHQLFHRQFESQSIEKSSLNQSPHHDYSLINSKYSIPRIEYAPVIYRQAVPTFELEKSIKLENEVPIVKKLTQFLTESSCAIPKQQMKNRPSRKKDPQRPLSVSTVLSADKRANKVHEKWPDYNEISEIVGYRIDPPLPKTITSTSGPSHTTTRRKQTKSTAFTAASKQIKNAVGLNASPARRPSSKNKKATKVTLASIVPDPPPPPPIPKPSRKESPSQLPAILCPSSLAYSRRAQTRQWLIRNHFSSDAMRTVPLL